MSHLVKIALGAASVIVASHVLKKQKEEVKLQKDSYYDSLYHKWGSVYGVPWKRLKAIAIIESSEGTHPKVSFGINHPDDHEASVSDDGKSYGLMQLRLSTAQDYDRTATIRKLNNPDYSVKIASLHLARLDRIFQDEDHIVKAYNQGEGNMLKEINGVIRGYSEEYLARYKRALGSLEG